MSSFRITITPSKRAAGRCIHSTRRNLQKALAEENAERGLTQTALAQAIGVHRSVISRELNGKKDITLGRVGELAWAMGRKATIEFPKTAQNEKQGTNVHPQPVPMSDKPLSAQPSTQIDNLIKDILQGKAAPAPVKS